MFLGFISVCCFLTSITGTTNPQRLAPEILPQGPINPSNSQNDELKNIFSGVTRPRPIKNNVVQKHQEPRSCQNSEILVKILNILQKLVPHDSSKGDMVSDVLNSVKENLKSDPENIKSSEILNNLNDLENLIEVDDGTPKPVLRQYTYRSAPGKLKTKIVFKYELPSINHPNCREAFDKLIQTAHDAYIKLSNDPMCKDNGQNGNNLPNHKEINNPEQHPFNYFSNPESLNHGPSGNDDSSTLNSVPRDLLFHMKNNNLDPDNMLELFRNYNLEHNHLPNRNSIIHNPNGLDFPPNFSHLHSYSTNNNDDIKQINPRYLHPNITPDNYNNINIFNQMYKYDANGNLNSKFPVTEDLKSKIPISNNNELSDNIFNIKYPENIISPASNVNNSNNQPSYDVITDMLNKYSLAKNTPHKHPEYQVNGVIPNDNNKDGPDVIVDKLPFKQNDNNGHVPNDSVSNKPNYEQYINEIKNLISQNSNQLDQKPDVQNGIYHQDLTIDTKHFPNAQNHHDHSLDSVPNLHNGLGLPYVNGKNPYQINVNNFNPNLPTQNTMTVNKNGIYQINPNLNNIKNAATYYNGVQYFPKDLANINGGNKHNIAVPHLHYHPVEEITSPNLQHLLSITNLYKLNDFPHKADIIELTYMLKRSEPLVYQPFYIVKYRLPYTKFLNNVRDLILRKPYLRTNHEKLYQELIALSNVTETSDDLKGYPKEDIVKLTFNNGALVTAKILNANDTNINEQLKVIQNLNSNLKPEDILKLNNDNANKYYIRQGKNSSEPLDSKVNNNSVKVMRSLNYGNGFQYQDPGNYMLNPLQQNNQIPALPNLNSNVLNPNGIPLQGNPLQQNNQIPVLPNPNSNMLNPNRIPLQANNIWNRLQQNNQRPGLPNPNLSVINPSIIPAVLASQQALSNRLPMYQQQYGK